MKPANFPGNKNARRLMALENLKRQTWFSSAQDKNRNEREIRTLEARIYGETAARAVRTKKARTARRRSQ